MGWAKDRAFFGLGRKGKILKKVTPSRRVVVNLLPMAKLMEVMVDLSTI